MDAALLSAVVSSRRPNPALALLSSSAVWVDPADLGGMRQDRAGASATVAAAVGSPVGSVRNKGTAAGWFTAPSDAARSVLRQDAVTGAYYLEPDGVDDWLVSSPLIDLGETWWHVGGWRGNSNDATAGRAFTVSSTSTNSIFEFGIGGGVWQAFNSSSSLSTIAPGNASLDAVLSVTRSPSEYRGWYNGVAGTAFAPVTQSGTLGLALFTQSNASASALLSGRFYGGAWGTGTVSAADRAILERHFGGLVGVTIP